MSLPIVFPCLQFMTLFKETGQVVVVQFLGEVMNETVWLCPTLCANIPVCRTQSRLLRKGVNTNDAVRYIRYDLY